MPTKIGFLLLCMTMGNTIFFRYCTILFGFVSSSFILNYILSYHASTISDTFIKDLVPDKFYCDNFIYTSDSSEQWSNVQLNVQKELARGGFHLREWNSNCQDVRDSIDPSVSSREDNIKILSYLYNTSKNCLQLKLPSLNCTASTKREIPFSVVSLYDPRGLFNPFNVKLKILLREIHLTKSRWDDKINDTLKIT